MHSPDPSKPNYGFPVYDGLPPWEPMPNLADEQDVDNYLRVLDIQLEYGHREDAAKRGVDLATVKCEFNAALSAAAKHFQGIEPPQPAQWSDKEIAEIVEYELSVDDYGQPWEWHDDPEKQDKLLRCVVLPAQDS